MKNLLILFSIIFLGAATSFAQVYNVEVSWQAGDCLLAGCGDLANDYFKINVVVYDDANSVEVDNETVYVHNMSATTTDVPVDDVETYCGKTHDFTPSFTTTATVWIMDSGTNPETACCTGSVNVGPKNCHEFYSDDIETIVGELQ